MSNATINQVSEQFSQAFEPARAFAGLTVDHVEKLANFQLEATRAYADLGLAQAREALQIADLKSFQDYAAKQKDVAETVTKRVQDDAQKLGELGKAYTEEATRLTEQSVARAQTPAKPARRTGASKSGGASGTESTTA